MVKNTILNFKLTNHILLDLLNAIGQFIISVLRYVDNLKFKVLDLWIEWDQARSKVRYAVKKAEQETAKGQGKIAESAITFAPG